MRKSHFKKHVVSLFLCLSLFLHAYTVFPSEPRPQSESKLAWVIKNIKENEKNLKTFIAKFMQNKKSSLLQKPLESKGLIYFDSAGKILLSVTTPSPVKLLLKGGRVLIYYPDLLEAEERYLGGDNILRKYFGIGQSSEELKEQYLLRLVPKAHSDTYHLKLIPKMEAIAKYIEAIEVRVSPKHWLPERIDVWERNGDYTSIKLEFTSINAPLPPDIFIIDIPEDL